MARASLLVALIASAAGALRAQQSPDSLLIDDNIVLFEDGAATDSVGFLIYPDSTVGYYRYDGSDTLKVDYFSAIYLGKAVEAVIDQRDVEPPLLTAEVVGDQIYIRIGRAIPIPAALAMAVIVPLVVLALIVYLARRLSQEKQQRSRLEEASRQIAASREDERLRLARELHDGPLQDLHALHMQLGLTAEALHQLGGAEIETRRVRGTLDDAHTVIGELRGIMEALRPPALGPFGLAAALRSHTDRFRQRFPAITINLDLDEDGLQLREEVRLVLFRIAQEAMNNAAKHAEPSRIDVTLRLNEATTTLDVVDDGRGLSEPPDTRALAAEGHFGFIGMHERARSIGGDLRVESTQGEGTSISIRAACSSGTPLASIQ